MSRMLTNLLIATIALFAAGSQAVAMHQWYFGMHVKLTELDGEKVLLVVSVNHLSPAADAGLQVGDKITEVNGDTFHGAATDLEAVAILRQATSSPLFKVDCDPTTLVGIPSGTAYMQVVTDETAEPKALVCYPLDLNQATPYPHFRPRLENGNGFISGRIRGIVPEVHTVDRDVSVTTSIFPVSEE